jgi:hypothetical protein
LNTGRYTHTVINAIRGFIQSLQVMDGIEPTGSKPKRKMGGTLDGLPGARTISLPLAVWGIEVRIPTLS